MSFFVDAFQLAVVLASMAVGAAFLRYWLLPGWTGAPARLAEVVLGISLLILVLELVGVVGLYYPGIVLAASIAAAVAIAYFVRTRVRAEGALGPPSPAVAWPSIAIAAGAAMLVTAHWAIPTQAALDVGMYLPNTTWHNMPFAARFVQEAQVGALHLTEPLSLSVWFYPQNSELLHSAGILFLGNDFLSPIINIGWMALALLAAWCIGRPYAAGAAAVLGVALLMDANLLLLYEPGDAKNDVIGLFFLLAAVALLVNGEAERRREDVVGEPPPSPWDRFGKGALIVAALAAGVALGTRLNLLAPIAALTLGVIALSPRGARLRTGGIWIGAMLITGGFWFARNLFTAGNPLPWIKGIGPIEFPHPDQVDLVVREQGKVADYLTDGGVITDIFVPALKLNFGDAWIVVLATLALAVVLAVWRGRTPVVRVLGVVAAVSAIAYVFTPLTAAGDPGSLSGFERNMRYIAPGAMIAIVLLPLVRGLGGEPIRRWGVVAFLGALLLITSLPSNVWDQGYRNGAVALALTLIALPVGAVVALQRGLPRAAVIAAVAALAVAAAFEGRDRERAYLDGRYRADTAPVKIPFGIPAAMEWANRIDDARIGVVGTQAGFKQYLFYGDQLENTVQYVGDEGPNGELRPILACPQWRRAVNAGDYDYLITAPYHLEAQRREDLLPPVDEAVWTGGDPNAKRVLRDSKVTVYAIRGDLDPDGCPPEGRPAQRR